MSTIKTQMERVDASIVGLRYEFEKTADEIKKLRAMYKWLAEGCKDFDCKHYADCKELLQGNEEKSMD